MRAMSKGRGEHCDRSFDYYLVYSGFGDCLYAYCDRCGMTAIPSHWNIRFPKSRTSHLPYEEIPREMESLLGPCPCGGSFSSEKAPSLACYCPYRSFLNTEPDFMTNFTCWSSVMSLRGSPETAT